MKVSFLSLFLNTRSFTIASPTLNNMEVYHSKCTHQSSLQEVGGKTHTFSKWIVEKTHSSFFYKAAGLHCIPFLISRLFSNKKRYFTSSILFSKTCESRKPLLIFPGEKTSVGIIHEGNEHLTFTERGRTGLPWPWFRSGTYTLRLPRRLCTQFSFP